jgi:hypothetical protein
MTAAAVRLGVKKELRALAGPWAACVVMILALAALGSRHPSLVPLVVPTYIIGLTVLGAMSIGHEYTNRTLAVLLAQPMIRGHLLLLKLTVLAAALATFAGLFTLLFWGDPHVAPLWMIVGLPVLCGLFAAPWLTMATRSATAGALFTMAIPGMCFTASALLYFLAYRRAPTADVETAVASTIALAFSAVGAVLGWRGFIRLEAMDGAAAGVRMPEWLAARTASTAVAAASRRHGVWELLKKELRLQQLTLVVAALYVLSFLTVRWLQPYVVAWLAFSPDKIDDIMGAVMFFYPFMIVMLTGSLASAEERQLGTLEWQMLLPVAAWKQWAVKVGVVLALSLIVTLGAPSLFFDVRVRFKIVRLELAVLVATLATGSLYVSSLCASGLRALVISVAATFAAVLVVSLSADVLLISAVMQQRYAPVALGAVLSLLFTWRGLANHRSAEPGIATLFKR